MIKSYSKKQTNKDHKESTISCPEWTCSSADVPYPAGPVRVCCAEGGRSSAECVWRMSDRPPGWWRSQPLHWGTAAGLLSPPTGTAGQYPAAHAGTAAGPFSQSGTPALLEEWAGRSPTHTNTGKTYTAIHSQITSLWSLHWELTWMGKSLPGTCRTGALLK